MTQFLVLVAGFFLFFAGAAEAGPIPGFIAAINAWGATALGVTGLGLSIAKTVIGLGLSALSRAYAKKKMRREEPGITVKTTTAGSVEPQRFILGKTCTSGHLFAPRMTYQTDGNPNEWLVYTIELSDLPISGYGKFYMEGEELTFASDPRANLSDPLWPGATVTDEKYANKVFVRIQDGTQTTADAYMRHYFADYPERPWTANMILKGVAYMVVTFKGKVDDNVYTTGLPSVKIEVEGVKLLDPRTGLVQYTENPMVMAWNLLKGIQMNVPGEVYGYGYEVADISQAEAFAAMNACDTMMATVNPDGTRRRYKAGIEVMVDREPQDILQPLLNACGGDFADMGGYAVLTAGPPPVSTFSFTDDDLSIISPETFTPFPPLDQIFNGISGSFPDPKKMWEVSPLKPIYNPAWEEADGGRSVTQLDLNAVSDGRQANAVLREMILDHRRMRNHMVTLPPDAQGVKLLHTGSWYSPRSGYTGNGKLFEVRGYQLSSETGDVTLQLRERDPSDYNPDVFKDADLPVAPPPRPVTPAIIGVAGFDAVAIVVAGDNGRALPAIQLVWNPETQADAVIYEVQRVSTLALVSNGPVLDISKGEHIVTEGLLRNTVYRVRARRWYPKRKTVWSDWVQVTTPDVGGVKPGDVDPTPPTKPGAVTLTSTTSSLIATWARHPGSVADELEITQAGGNPLIFGTSGLRYVWEPVLPGTLFTVRRRALDALGNRSEWSDPTTHTVMADTVPPPQVTGLKVNGSFGAYFLSWDRSPATDLSHYQISMGTANPPTTILPDQATSNYVFITGQPDSQERNFRVRAVDTSGNNGAWSTVVTASTLSPVDPTITTEDLVGLIDNTSFKNGTQPIRIHTGAALPTTYIVDVIAWQGALYRWDPATSKYVSNVLGPNAVQTAHLDAGVVTTQKLAVGFGGNFITNSDFKAGTTGWTLGGSGTTFTQSNMAVNPAGQPYAGVNFPTLRVAQTGTVTGGYADLRFRGIKDSSGAAGSGHPVNPGDWIEASAALAPFRCNVELRIEWRKEDGTPLGSYSPATSVAAGSWSATNPKDWTRVWTRGQAPASAAYAVIHIRKLATSSGTDSLLFINEPMMTSSGENRTEVTPYAPGSFTLVDGQGLLTGTVDARAVNVVDLAVSGLANLNVAYIKEANVSGQLSASIIRGGTALLGTVTINGTALGTINDRAADPAARVNAAETKIDPGKILIQGATTLADWRGGGDNTDINGGKIATDSVRSNSLEIGSRNVTVEGITFSYDRLNNIVSWTGGNIRYPERTGVFSTSVPSGSGTWTSGILYVVYTKGTNTLWATASSASAFHKDVLILATYTGAERLNSYFGRTLIDGWGVQTDNILVRNNAQMGALTVTHFNMNGYAVAKVLKAAATKWKVAGVDSNVLKFTYNPPAGDQNSGWTHVLALAVRRIKGYSTELFFMLDHAAGGSNIFGNPNTSLLQMRIQRKLTTQGASSWATIANLNSSSGEAGSMTTNVLSHTDGPAPSDDPSNAMTMYRIIARKTNDTRMQKMSPYVYNVRATLTHYKQG